MPSVKAAKEPAQPESIAKDGSVEIRNVKLPFSAFASEEARKAFIARFTEDEFELGPDLKERIDEARAHYDRFNDQCLAKIEKACPFESNSSEIGGVRVQRVVSRSADARRRGVLICLHGGGFLWGAGAGELVEAAPIAAAAGMPVVTVDYRMAPEHAFPAASDDVVTVYEHLLGEYDPSEIGIYGSSAGAILTTQSIARFDNLGLPKPAAIGAFFGSFLEITSDSSALAAPSLGQHAWRQSALLASLPYFEDADMSDPLVLPGNSSDLLTRFPPTLVATSTRDFAMSACVTAHRKLITAGVAAELHVWDGLWHAFPVDCDLPESQDFYNVVAEFFERRLST